MTPVVTSIAAVWTPTAASARTSEPEAVISRAGLSARHSGTSAGTSISPAPCAVAIAKDHSAMPACPMAMGSRARRTCAPSPARTPHAAANIQPVAGLNPCMAPRPAMASHGHRFAMVHAPA